MTGEDIHIGNGVYKRFILTSWNPGKILSKSQNQGNGRTSLGYGNNDSPYCMPAIGVSLWLHTIGRIIYLWT